MSAPHSVPPVGPTASPADRPPAFIATRLALYFFAIFLFVGVMLPYWPVYLESRGLSPEAIGLVTAIQFWIKVGGNPLVAGLADRHGSLRTPIILLSLAAAAAYLAFEAVDGLIAMVLVAALFGFTGSPLMLLGDSLTLRAIGTYRAVRHLDYGRLRLWGSISFILALMVVGEVIETQPAVWILYLIVGALLATGLTGIALPDLRPDRPARRGSILDLVRQPAFQLFLLTASLSNASHAVYYGFSAIHWRDAGLDGLAIGLLWAEGVVAEILLFAFGRRLADRLGAARLFALAGLGGILRWSVLAVTTDPAALASVQWLHGLTFGALHLGTIRFLDAAVPTRVMATAQSLYSAVPMGISVGLAMLWAGNLYAGFGSGAFFAMAGLGGLGLLSAFWLQCRWDGGRLPGVEPPP